MIRRLSYCLLAALVLVSACTKVPQECNGPAVQITVRCDSPERVKAGSDDTQDGENRYNENLISTVDFFFYPGRDPDRTAAAVLHVRRNSGLRGSDVFLLDLSPEDVNERLFPYDQAAGTDVREATVFAVVNYPGLLVQDEGDLSGTSLETLEALQVETDFVLSGQNYKQPDFMMSGTTVLDLRSRTSNIAATGTIDLVRYASKMTVSVKVAATVTLGNAVWEPMLEDMAIYLVNGVNTVTLGGEDPTPAYFSFSGNKKKFAYIDTQDGDKLKPLVGKNGEYYDAYPMYMYPQQWTYGETDDSSYRTEPYLKLELPWHRIEGGASTQRQCYYKIFIPNDLRGEGFVCRFVRNNWYHLDIDVGLLGADTDDAAVELPGSFFMVPWQNVDREIERQADIGNARYLSLDKTRYELHNVPSTDIRYTTSHPIAITDIRATCPYYGEKTSGEARGGVITKVTSDDDIYPKDSYYLNYDEAHRRALTADGSDWLTDTGTAIRFCRPLKNDYTDPNFDYSPYTVSFTACHADRPDDARYRKAAVVIQTPAIFIESHKNSDDTFVYTGITRASGQIWASDHWGYVYVDGRQIVRSRATYENGHWVENPPYSGDTAPNISQAYLDYFRSQYPDDPAVQAFGPEDFHWRVVWYTGGSRDIFKIDTTVLPDGSDLVIGDPRTDTPDPAYSNVFKVADAIEGGQRSLTWYYPAEKSDRTVNMMAPSYRISSKISGTEFGSITEEQAKWRCATFQEDGYPAGRWRLPTKGEIRFIAQLSANGAFERLFSANGKYWSANGAIQVSGSSVIDVSDTKAMSRCVYDVWYWGDEQTNHPTDGRAHFYWGDDER